MPRLASFGGPPTLPRKEFLDALIAEASAPRPMPEMVVYGHPDTIANLKKNLARAMRADERYVPLRDK